MMRRKLLSLEETAMTLSSVEITAQVLKIFMVISGLTKWLNKMFVEHGDCQMIYGLSKEATTRSMVATMEQHPNSFPAGRMTTRFGLEMASVTH